jgi:hypothetical protein
MCAVAMLRQTSNSTGALLYGGESMLEVKYFRDGWRSSYLPDSGSPNGRLAPVSSSAVTAVSPYFLASGVRFGCQLLMQLL